MKKIVSLRVVSLFFFSLYSVLSFSTELEETNITFRPNLNVGVERTIKMSFKGHVYSEKDKKLFKKLMDPSSDFDLNEVEKKAIEIVKVNQLGDKDRIMKQWNPPERDKIKKMVDDQVTFQKNLSFYKNIRSTTFVAIMQYGDYFLCFLEHDVQGIGSYIKIYPLLKGKDGQIYLSNLLMNDFFFDKIAFSLLEFFKKP